MVPPDSPAPSSRSSIMRTWFVTGASRGFGALIVKEALAKGDAVVAMARNPKSVTDRFGDHPNLLPVEIDVNDESNAQDSAKATVDSFGSTDVSGTYAAFVVLSAVTKK